MKKAKNQKQKTVKLVEIKRLWEGCWHVTTKWSDGTSTYGEFNSKASAMAFYWARKAGGE